MNTKMYLYISEEFDDDDAVRIYYVPLLDGMENNKEFIGK